MCKSLATVKNVTVPWRANTLVSYIAQMLAKMLPQCPLLILLNGRDSLQDLPMNSLTQPVLAKHLTISWMIRALPSLVVHRIPKVRWQGHKNRWRPCGPRLWWVSVLICDLVKNKSDFLKTEAQCDGNLLIAGDFTLPVSKFDTGFAFIHFLLDCSIE